MDIDSAIIHEKRNAEIAELKGKVSDFNPVNAINYYHQLVEWLKDYKRLLAYDDAKYHEEHGEVIVAKDLWEDAKRALMAIEDIRAEIKEYRDACSDGEWDYYLAGRIEAYNDALAVIDEHI